MASNNPLQRFTRTATDLAVLNAETTGKVLLRQSQAWVAAVQAGVDQTRAVLGAESVSDAVAAQRDYARTLAETAREAGRDSWETVQDAGRKASDVVRGSVSSSAEGTANAAA